MYTTIRKYTWMKHQPFLVVVLLISANKIKRKMRLALGLRVSSHLYMSEHCKTTMTYKLVALWATRYAHQPISVQQVCCSEKKAVMTCPLEMYFNINLAYFSIFILSLVNAVLINKWTQKSTSCETYKTQYFSH